MNRFTVITSINPPTDAVRQWAQVSDGGLIVVGDRKSPDSWELPGCHFLALSDHKYVDAQLDEMLPLDHYCRKMIGYLHAAKLNADQVIDTDDDNRPKSTFSFPLCEGEYETLHGIHGWVNVYSYFTERPIWPRGLPLDQIRHSITPDRMTAQCRVGVWQGLADLDPDVDALFRLLDGSPCIFDERDPVVLSNGIWSPFNSQNTLFVKELFPLLYLPSTVSFRFTDILRSVVAQPIMWAHGFVLGFTSASVEQDRNPHNLMSDFEQEIPMYLYVKTAAEIAQQVVDPGKSINENLLAVYVSLRDEKIVGESEPLIVETWLEALQNL